MKQIKTVILLFAIFFLCTKSSIPIHSSHQEGQANPGIEIQLTSESINNLLSKYLIPEINYELDGLEFPNVDYEESENEYIKLTSIRLETINIDKEQTNFKAENGEILFNLRIKNSELRFHYYAKNGLLQSSGKHAYVKVDWVNFRIHMDVINDEGRIQLVTKKVDSTIGKLKIVLGLGPVKYWVNKIVTNSVNKSLNSWAGVIEQSIIQTIQIINQNIGDQLMLPIIKTQGDLQLISDPLITENQLTLKMNGYFHPIGKSTKLLYNKYPFQPYNDSQASKIYISQKSINSLMLSVLRSHSKNGLDHLRDLFGQDPPPIIKFKGYYLILIDF